MNLKIRDRVETTPLYKPGLPIELVAREKGLNPADIIKLASNENPLGPSPKAVTAMQAALTELHRYPDGGAWELSGKLSQKLGVTRDQIILGNGSNEIIEFLGQAFLQPGTNVIMGEFPFVVYPLVTHHFGAEARKIPMPGLKHDLPAMLDAVDENTRLICVASPNNPTPYHNTHAEILHCVENLPEHVVFCFDGAYLEYLNEAPDLLNLIQQKPNVIILRTFSKIYGLGGLRLGYAYSSPELIAVLQRTRQPFNVSSVAQAGGIGALDDTEFVNRSKAINDAGIEQISAALGNRSIEYHRGETNFMLVKVPGVSDVCESLLEKGVIVRSMANFGLDDMFRVSIGVKSENEKFLECLFSIL